LISKQFCVYILSNRPRGTLYIGVTSNLAQRIGQHREKQVEGFSKRYDLRNLVWFEMHETAESAILREKQIKKWNRIWKLKLIEQANPSWRDFFGDIV